MFLPMSWMSPLTVARQTAPLAAGRCFGERGADHVKPGARRLGGCHELGEKKLAAIEERPDLVKCGDEVAVDEL